MNINSLMASYQLLMMDMRDAWRRKDKREIIELNQVWRVILEDEHGIKLKG